MADEDERLQSPDGVFAPILMRSSTPPASEKVSSFLRGMADVRRVSKPVSNYGSEFEHIASSPSAWDSAKINLIGGRPVTIPADAQDMHDLNEELFNQGDDSEMSYGGALNNNHPNGNGYDQPQEDPNEEDDIESVVQEHASVAQTPRQVPQQILSPGKAFRNGKVIDSSSSWGNKGPLPANAAPPPQMQPMQPRYTESSVGHAPMNNGPTPITPFINIQPPTSGAPSRSGSRMAPSDAGRSRNGAPPKSHTSEVRAMEPQTDSETEKAETVRGGAQEVVVEARPASRAPSRSGSRAPSRTRSRAQSRSERPLEPQSTGYTDHSRAPSRTPSKVPLPSSPKSGSFSYAPMAAPPSRSPSKAPGSRAPTHNGSVAPARSERPLSPLGQGSRRAPSPAGHVSSRTPPPKQSDRATSTKSPTRLHPLTDMLREKEPSHKAPSAVSERSHRTATTNARPPAAPMHATQNPGSMDGRPSRTKLTAQPVAHSHSRTGSRVSKRSGLSKEQSRRDDSDDDEVDTQMKSLVMHDNPSRDMVTEIDLTRTPRTSYTAFTTPSVLAHEVNASHFHDEELCILLHAADNPATHDVVRKVLRKGVKDRVNKLGLDHQRELAIARKHHRDGVHRHKALKGSTIDGSSPAEEKPPKWAEGLFEILKQQQETINHLEERQHALSRRAIAPPDSETTEEDEEDEGGTVRGATEQATTVDQGGEYDDEYDDPQTPHMTVPIETPRGEEDELYDEEDEARTETRSRMGTATQREYEDELADEYEDAQVGKPQLYRLRIKQNPNEATWHVTDTNATGTAQLPEIPGSEGGYMEDTHAPPEEEELRHHEVQDNHAHDVQSPPLPPLPLEAWSSQQSNLPPSWQRVYQRLLNWALVWSEGELQRALQSTQPGSHVDEVALTVWITQTYKRYVRAKHVEHPPGRVDRLFVPPNIADAINIAVFHGRHGDARNMLRDLWASFGFEGMPRLIIALARHRRDSNHYVVHRFALPEGALTTYDTYPEKTLADGRPLGWWFAIQSAWPNGMYPQPDNLVQKIIRINRPMQLNVDNSVAAAAIWRNLIMGSKAERSVDLVRLRDLISTEVKSIISRKELGRLSVMGGKSQWEETQP